MPISAVAARTCNGFLEHGRPRELPKFHCTRGISSLHEKVSPVPEGICSMDWFVCLFVRRLVGVLVSHSVRQ